MPSPSRRGGTHDAATSAGVGSRRLLGAGVAVAVIAAAAVVGVRIAVGPGRAADPAASVAAATSMSASGRPARSPAGTSATPPGPARPSTSTLVGCGALYQATINQDALTANAKQIAGAGDFTRGSPELQRHHGCCPPCYFITAGERPWGRSPETIID